MKVFSSRGGAAAGRKIRLLLANTSHKLRSQSDQTVPGSGKFLFKITAQGLKVVHEQPVRNVHKNLALRCRISTVRVPACFVCKIWDQTLVGRRIYRWNYGTGVVKANKKGDIWLKPHTHTFPSWKPDRHVWWHSGMTTLWWASRQKWWLTHFSRGPIWKPTCGC